MGVGGLFNLREPAGMLCLVRTQFTPSGNDDIGFTETGGWSVAASGASLGVSLDYQISDANTLQELCCRFHEESVSNFGAGLGGVASYFWGTARDGRHIHGVDFGGSFGYSPIGSAAIYSTWTDVQQQNSVFVANPLRWIWDSLTPPGVGSITELSNIIRHAEGAAASKSSPAANAASSGSTACQVGISTS